MVRLAEDLRRTLGAPRIYMLTVDKDGTLRVRGGIPDGETPSPRPVSDYPALARAIALERTSFVEDPLASDADPGTYAVLPLAGFRHASGVVVVAGPVAEACSETPLDAVRDAIVATIVSLGEGDDLQRRIREFEEWARVAMRMFDACSDAIFFADLDGIMRRWNPAAERLYGWTAEEAIGSMLPMFASRSRGRAVEEIRRVASRGVVADGNDIHVRKDGSRIHVLVTSLPCRDGDGHATGVVHVMRDLAHDSRLEAVQGRFTALASQQLRNPLTAVLGYAQLMLRPEVIEDPASRARVATALEARAREMSEIVDDLLLVTEIETEGLALDEEPAELPALATEVVARFESMRGGHRFVLDVDASMPCLRADRRRLEQALANLLSNAVKYSPAGEDVLVSAFADGLEGVLSVSDGGVGIDEALLPELFERFARGEPDDVRHATGTGLGLYIVRAIADAHGGRVEARRNSGKGSTFSIRLPLGDDR